MVKWINTYVENENLPKKWPKVRGLGEQLMHIGLSSTIVHIYNINVLIKERRSPESCRLTGTRAIWHKGSPTALYCVYR